MINRVTWIAHKARYRCYKKNNGRRNLVDSEFVFGEELMVGFKVGANSSKANNHRWAFQKYTGAPTVIDLATRFKIGKPLISHK